MKTHVLEHPLLGRIKGVQKTDTVVQYLGLQYATLKDRFARAELAVGQQGGDGDVIDATKHG